MKILNYVRNMFGTKTSSKPKVKVEPKCLTVQDFRRDVASQIKASSCGCSRHPARDAYESYSSGNRYAIENLRLFEALDDQLHSYCANTSSSYTSSNAEVMKDVLRSSERILGSTDSTSFKVEAAATEQKAIRRLAGDASYAIDEEKVLGYLDRCKTGIANGDLAMSLSGLESATTALNCISENYASSRVVIAPKLAELSQYLASNMVSIAKKKCMDAGEMKECLKYALNCEAIRSKLPSIKKQKLTQFISKDKPSLSLEETFRANIERKYGTLTGLVRSCESDLDEQLNEVNRNYASDVSNAKRTIENAENKQRSYPSQGNSTQLANANEQLTRINHIIEQEKSKVTAQYAPAILEAKTNVENYKTTTGALFEKMKKRTMTRAEYMELKKLNSEAKK